MFKKKNKKKYSNSKIHFIIFKTSDKPINLSVPRIGLAVCCFALTVFVIASVAYSVYTYSVNKDLSKNVVQLQSEVVDLKTNNQKAEAENDELRDTLNSKTSEIETKLNELNEMQQQMESVLGLEKELEDQAGAAQPPTVSSRSMTSMHRSDPDDAYAQISDFNEKLSDLSVAMDHANAELLNLENTVEEKLAYLKSLPTLFPTEGTVTSGFGNRWGYTHRGIDIANKTGTPIYVAGSGTVIECGYHSSYGYQVVVNHGNDFTTRYAHMSEIKTELYSQVEQGDLIGLIGNTGTSYGSHLHFEVYYKNELIDPLTVSDYID